MGDPFNNAIYVHNQHCVCSGNIQMSRINNLKGPQRELNTATITKKAPAEDVLIVSAQEALPALGAADAVLHHYYSSSSLFIYHCPVWICHQTGQEQTTMDSQECRDIHWCQPALHLGPIHVESQETDRKHHCRSITPLTQPFFHYFPLGGATELCMLKQKQKNSFFPQAITVKHS